VQLRLIQLSWISSFSNPYVPVINCAYLLTMHHHRSQTHRLHRTQRLYVLLILHLLLEPVVCFPMTDCLLQKSSFSAILASPFSLIHAYLTNFKYLLHEIYCKSLSIKRSYKGWILLDIIRGGKCADGRWNVAVMLFLSSNQSELWELCSFKWCD